MHILDHTVLTRQYKKYLYLKSYLNNAERKQKNNQNKEEDMNK